MSDVPELRVTTEHGGYYVDRVAVVFRAIDDLSRDNDLGPSIGMAVNTNGAGLDLEAVNRELEELAFIGGGRTGNYQSTIRATHTSWGADGASAVFLLSVGGQLTAEIILAGLWRIGAAVRRRAVAEARPITQPEAEHWAKVMVAARYEAFDRRAATTTKVALRESSASVEMRGADGSTFAVELELQDGLIAVGEVSRTYPAA